MERQTSIDAVEAVLCEWLADTHIAVVCGSWAHGAMGELFPAGRASLTPAAYDSPFEGVRDLVLDDQRHHLHVDLAQIDRVRYAITPSVCFDWGPSFEVRLCRGGRPDEPVLAVALTDCYRGGALDRGRVRAFLNTSLDHQARFGELIELTIEAGPTAPTPTPAKDGSSHWSDVLDWAHGLGIAATGIAPTDIARRA